MIFWKDFVFDENLGAILEVNEENETDKRPLRTDKKVTLSSDEYIKNKNNQINRTNVNSEENK